MSRPNCTSEALGISCNPYSGEIHVSHNTKFTTNLEAELCQSCTEPPRSFCTTLDWELYHAPPFSPKRGPCRSGLMISSGTLEFFLSGPSGLDRSGTICECLPPKVLGCAFLLDFVGEASVCIG